MEDKSYLISCIIIILIILIVVWYEYLEGKKIALRENMRKLWVNEILWTKSYTMAIIENNGDDAEKASINRLRLNHDDLAELIYKGYSIDKSKLATDMNEYIISYGTLVKHSLNNEMDEAKATWLKTVSLAKSIGGQMKVNKYLQTTILHKMLNTYSQNISQIFTTRIARDWTKNTLAVDIALNHATAISDYISGGISADKYSLTSI